MKISSFVIISLLSLIILISGCTTSISDIKSNPEKYVGKELTVSGVVKNSVKIGSLSGYTLVDENGATLNVASDSLPAQDSQVSVKGTLVKQSFIIATNYYLQASK